MNHAKAARRLRTECYILGEMPDAERDEFEQHFFVCRKCADDVRYAAWFAANARAVFRQEADERGAADSNKMRS